MGAPGRGCPTRESVVTTVFVGQLRTLAEPASTNPLSNGSTSPSPFWSATSQLGSPVPTGPPNRARTYPESSGSTIPSPLASPSHGKRSTVWPPALNFRDARLAASAVVRRGHPEVRRRGIGSWACRARGAGQGSQRRGADMPVIVLTGHGDVPTAVRAFTCGAVDFLEKPCRTQTLIDQIQHALQIDAKFRASRARKDKTAKRLGSLTERERSVVEMIASGMTTKKNRLRVRRQHASGRGPSRPGHEEAERRHGTRLGRRAPRYKVELVASGKVGHTNCNAGQSNKLRAETKAGVG